MRLFAWAAAATLAAASLTPAAAGTLSSTLGVQMVVTAGCTAFSTSGTLDLGTVAPGGVGSSTGTVSVTCSNGVAYKVLMNAGLHSLNGSRYLSDGAGDLRGYSFSPNANYSPAWGDDGATLPAQYPSVAGTGNGGVQTLNAYGQAGANVNTPAGTYTDTITATLSF